MDTSFIFFFFCAEMGVTNLIMVAWANWQISFRVALIFCVLFTSATDYAIEMVVTEDMIKKY